ncbi:hypothetical protein QJS10_CPA16g00543 [Acorus calamus]|uniref:Uncharacterized protein n=1 Tax=Acorus calamus TaxID=4465 RepID=A0AAV9D0Q1_ACOCL|nr:hypothetical protein QJS10_CPA16g00543 [Acorus calamus]
MEEVVSFSDPIVSPRYLNDIWSIIYFELDSSMKLTIQPVVHDYDDDEIGIDDDDDEWA